MIPAYPTVTAATNLMHDMGHTTLTLDTVYAIYAAIGLGTIGLWTFGVLVFGQVGAKRATAPAPRAERITPVVP